MNSGLRKEEESSRTSARVVSHLATVLVLWVWEYFNAFDTCVLQRRGRAALHSF
jgi:hypothetical protein